MSTPVEIQPTALPEASVLPPKNNPAAADAVRIALKTASSAHLQNDKYTDAAKSAADALNKLGQFDEQQENGNPSVKSVVNGLGKNGNYYSIRKQTDCTTVAELNKICGLTGNKFTPALEAQIKEFQKALVEKDPTWKALEAELKKSGKSLIDGKVGPMTIAALVSNKLLQRNDKGQLVAVPEPEAQ